MSVGGQRLDRLARGEDRVDTGGQRTALLDNRARVGLEQNQVPALGGPPGARSGQREDVHLRVAVEVSGRHQVYPASLKRRVLGLPELPGAGPEVDRGSAVRGCREIGFAVLVEVCRGEVVRLFGVDQQGRAKAPGPRSAQDRDLASEAHGLRQIRLAVAVEVADNELSEDLAGLESSRSTERARAVAEKDGELLRLAVGDGQVEVAVPAEVGDGE